MLSLSTRLPLATQTPTSQVKPPVAPQQREGNVFSLLVPNENPNQAAMLKLIPEVCETLIHESVSIFMSNNISDIKAIHTTFNPLNERKNKAKGISLLTQNESIVYEGLRKLEQTFNALTAEGKKYKPPLKHHAQTAEQDFINKRPLGNHFSITSKAKLVDFYTTVLIDLGIPRKREAIKDKVDLFFPYLQD